VSSDRAPLRLGIVGHPVGHSRSPALHGAFGLVLGLELIYERYDVPRSEDLAARLGELAADGVRGVNVTVPHKVACAGLAERLTPEARRAGAVNTLRFHGGRVALAHNTDIGGLAASLAGAGVELAGRDALLLGAGGAARAAALVLARGGASARVAARRLEQAEALAGVVGAAHPPAPRPVAIPWEDRAAALEGCDLVIQATPIGMHPRAEASPLPGGATLTSRHTVVDLVYNPLETRLLAHARRAGARAVDGLGMLVHQGIDALALWLERTFTAAERRALADAGRRALRDG
jgi:shikimate dehydrogenase